MVIFVVIKIYHQFYSIMNIVVVVAIGRRRGGESGRVGSPNNFDVLVLTDTKTCLSLYTKQEYCTLIFHMFLLCDQ